MDNQNQRNPLLKFAYYCQGKSMDELKHSLLCTTLELETTRVAAQEELKRREDQLTHLRDLLDRAIRDRDEAQEKSQKLFSGKYLLRQQNPTPLYGVSSIEDEPRRGVDSNNAFFSSDCEKSIVSSPVLPPPPPQQQPPSVPADPSSDWAPEKPLPEKGNLLQAVIKAGPLLQTLLLAGSLPQWRHPPPPIDTFDIPPVTIPSPSPPFSPRLLHHQHPPSLINCGTGVGVNIGYGCGRVNRKRTLCCEGSDNSSTETKFQRVVLLYILLSFNVLLFIYIYYCVF